MHSFLISLLAGCSSDVGPEADDAACTVVETPLEDTTPPLSEGELWAAISAISVSSVVWSELPDAASPTASASFSLEPGTGDAVVVERTGTETDTCRAGPELVVPVVIRTEMDEGQAVAEVSGHLGASSASLSDVFLIDVFGLVTLGDAWERLAAVTMEQECSCTAEDYHIGLSGSLVGVGVDLEGRRRDEDDNLAVLLWRGTLK